MSPSRHAHANTSRHALTSSLPFPLVTFLQYALPSIFPAPHPAPALRDHQFDWLPGVRVRCV
ncbi:hypothetical protein FA95DRAFT_1553219 [Auriscalpium vulgare]|uniref:Uncharacterized protein n=1 Tax=Auriscalpium vulgare TaxID=40419 RepID=A0ACB8SAJ7_9AGAM|nr:hypothetical protein FA95DRAFT_1553219 [Auriscalpium vulgare]